MGRRRAASIAKLLRWSATLSLAGGCARAPLPSEDAGLWDWDAAVPSVPAVPTDAAAEDDADTPGPVVDSGTPPTQDAGSTEPLPDAGAPDSGSPRPASDCKPGTYGGTFEGEIQILGFISLPIDGEISIGIHTTSTGDDLVIENGTIEGEDQDGNPVHAEVQGTLQCATRKLVGGRLLNGTYTRTGLNMTVNFQGSAEADYTPGDSPSVSGTWQTTGGLVERGSGTFEASLNGP